MESYVIAHPLKVEETTIPSLGVSKIKSPLNHSQFTNDSRQVLYSPFYNGEEGELSQASFEIAGPREFIYFDPHKVKAAIVTCGGICPGLNNVIRAIVLGLHHTYGVRSIFGIQYGLQGFIPEYEHDVIELTPHVVSSIHEQGGTILGTSRGEQPIDDIVDAMERMNLNMLFILGGDGTLRAAQKISKEVDKRGLKLSVVGIPKTIDNDISHVFHSFGFDSAVKEATQAIRSAHVEARSCANGVGLVKLMGRHSGFIAATAAIAQRDVNFVLIPEVDFELYGPDGFLEVLRKRVDERGHAVVVVAEGAGQKYFKSGEEVKTDASGNVKLHDIGAFLKGRIIDYFHEKTTELNIKYIDPSYLIRSVPANKSDASFCAYLGQNAVHAAMAGKTNMLVTTWHGVYCHNPLHLATRERKKVNPSGVLWLSVLESTGQSEFKNV